MSTRDGSANGPPRVPSALLGWHVGLASCSAIGKVKSAVTRIRGNKATIDAFSSTLQSGAAAPFEATYVTTGKRAGDDRLRRPTAHGGGLQRDAVGWRRRHDRSTSW